MVRDKKEDFEGKLKPSEQEAPEEKKKWFQRFGKKKPRQRRTAEEIAQERVAQAFTVDPKQIELFKPVIQIPFNVWADSIKIEQLRLKDDEAQNLATPVAQLINYYLPRISPIGYVWLSFALSCFSIMSMRLKLLADLRKKKKEEKPEKAK